MNKQMIASQIATILLQKSCLKVSPSSPFTYASGLKGPMYCDNRKILAFVEERALVIDAFVELIEELNLEYDAICGLATAGIPHGALIAERLRKPFIYARSKPKGHGKRNQIEGHFQSGDKVLIIEDLVNQGKSLEEAVLGIKDAELNPIACCSIVDYQMSMAIERAAKMQIPLYALTNFDSIMTVAVELNIINETEKSDLMVWQNNPQKWSDDFTR